MTRFSHAKRGILPSVIPGQRRHAMVVMMWTAVPMLPIPERSSPSTQKSVLWPAEKARDVSGA